MVRLLQAALIVAIVMGICTVLAPRAEAQTAQFQNQQAKPDQTAASADLAAALAQRPESRLGFFERRKLGLTFFKLGPIVAELKQQGKITGDNSAADAAVLLDELIHRDAQTWAAEMPQAPEARGEWLDAILRFLEAIMPLLLLIFGV